MKIGKKLLYCSLLLLYLFSFLDTNNTCISLLNDKINIPNKIYSTIKQDLTLHEPIVINHDDNFSSYAFSGDGSENNPFLIENYNITTHDNIGISISGTNNNFIIRNCYVRAENTCIKISNIKNNSAKIMNCYCKAFYDIYDDFQTDTGILVLNSNQIQIVNNDCFRNERGITIFNSEQSFITGNNCSFNWEYNLGDFFNIVDGCGIEILNSHNSTISNNFCMGNGEFGLYITSSNNTLLSDNSFITNGYYDDYIIVEEDRSGVVIYGSENITIMESFFVDNIISAILIIDCENIFIKNNTCIESWVYGLETRESSYLEIKFNIFTNGLKGVQFEETYYSLVVFNLFQNNTCYGLAFRSANHNIIHHNSFAYTRLDANYPFPGYQKEGSEAYDDSTNNTWYDKNKLEGNWWSNRKGKGAYEIDGITDVTDPYPLDLPPIQPTMKKPINVGIILIIIFSILGIIGIGFFFFKDPCEYRKKIYIEHAQIEDLHSEVQSQENHHKQKYYVLRYCKYCGNHIDSYTVYCSSCGKKLVNN